MIRKTKQKTKYPRIVYALPIISLCAVMFLGGAQKAIPDEINLANAESYAPQTAYTLADPSEEQSSHNIYTAKLFGILPTKSVKSKFFSNIYLVPGGDVFGVKFFTDGVVVTDLSEVESDEGIICPAKKAGLKPGDVVTSVNGHELASSEDLTEISEKSGGKQLSLEFERDGKKYKANLLPVRSSSDGMYKLGMWVRDSTAGIGTVTFYDPSDGSFAGLGHGIYDADTELLLPLRRGAVVDIELDDIVRGRQGHPGELKGSFGTEKTGSILKNTPAGVFGIMASPPQTIYEKTECAAREEVTLGDAVILSNVDGRGVKEYAVEITKIYSGNEETKNFVITVRDEKLMELTGGIVRGMSGSPIIQNGKLVGAVTHVFVNDPTRGYGIFIENMLAEAEKIK